MRRRTSYLLVTLALAAVFATGCGEDPEVEYQRGLLAVGTEVSESLGDVPLESEEPIAPAEVTSLADDLRGAADDVGELDPPDDAKAPQKRFQRGLRGVATALEQLGRDLAKAEDSESEQAERFVQFATDPKIERAFDDLKNAQDAYARAGYDVFPDAAPAPPVVSAD